MISEVETEINSFEVENNENEDTSAEKQCLNPESTLPSPTAVINGNNEFENNVIQNGGENFESVDISAQRIKLNTKKHRVIEDSSDSEEEISSPGETNKDEMKIVELLNEKQKKFIIDSDSETETGVTVHNKSFSDDASVSNEQIVYTTNSEGKLIPEDDEKGKSLATRLSSLCDPDSSEEEGYTNKDDEIIYSEEKEIIPKQYKKKNKTEKNEVEKPKKMSRKKAAELRKEIQSESQRMMREKNISLPYHKPKSRTLKEFLSRRPKFASAVPINVKAPPSVAIKMSTAQLALVSERLKEREKELEQFYKSEDESEDEQESKDVPPSETEVHNEEISAQPSEATGNILIPSSDENTNEEQSSQIENIISNSVEDVNDKEQEIPSLENNTDNASFKDCDTIEDTNASDLLVDATAEKEQETVTENLNEKEALPIDCPDDCLMKDIEENIALPEAPKINEKDQENTMDYEFNLDGLEENSETVVEKQNSEEKKSRPEYTDLDREIENFGRKDNDELPTNPMEQPKPLTKLDLIKENISKIKPKLSGHPNDVIDLETGITKPNEVTKLMERFLEHNFKKPAHKDKIELNIISFESGEIHKETVAMKLEDEEKTVVVEEKPGVKLQKLRNKLQNQMAQKRSELWQKKSTKQSNNEEDDGDEDKAEKDECGLDDDILDDEEEDEIEMTESSEEEEDEEEDDYSLNEKKKKKNSVFVNEEAEESNEEGDGVSEADDEDEGDEAGEAADEDGESNEADNEEEMDDSENDNETNQISQNKNKTYRKILKGFADDSDEEDLISESSNVKSNNENTNSFTQGDEDMPPPYQPQKSQTPVKQTEHKSDFEFLTPVSYPTGLQNPHNSSSKNLKDSPIVPSFRSVPSPLKEANWQQSLQKKLFADSEITDSQVEESCSGKFPETQEVDQRVKELPCTSNSNDMGHLVELCSGKFPSTAELADRKSSDQTPTSQDILNICSGGFTGITENDVVEEPKSVRKDPVDTYVFNKNKEVKSLGEDQDLIISQLMDEEEMEKFKKRFESPILSNTQRRIVEEFQETMAGGGVIDSDDDDDADTVGIKKKNKKRLMFSDDEDSADENKEEEEIDLHDDIEEDENINEEIDDIAYDSEENEIEIMKEDGGANLKPSDFFENEAELSESEWGSADEDEKDLDTLEFEQGDTEKYDEKKIRSDLEKIHMQRLLDDDTRQVKLLQEMLLEDGELHGTGRERQFRWRNIDSVVEEEEGRKEEDDVYFEEEESEEQWRKRRHEREMFLKEKLKKSQETDDDLLSGSELLKIGQKVLQRSQSNSLNNTPVDKTSTTSDSPVLRQSFSLTNQRGSFLSRGDQVLQRLAAYNKQTSVVLGTATAKNSRNFLFQSVSVQEITVTNKQDKKRKAADGTPNAIKKLRLSENFSPVAKKKPSAKARLFGNW